MGENPSYPLICDRRKAHDSRIGEAMFVIRQHVATNDFARLLKQSSQLCAICRRVANIASQMLELGVFLSPVYFQSKVSRIAIIFLQKLFPYFSAFPSH